MRQALHLAVSGLLVIGMIFSACASQDREDAAAGWVERARLANATADEAIARQDWDTARDALRAVLGADAAGVAAQDRRVVTQDLYYRLAEVELSAEAPAEALRWSNEGLSLGQEQDVFSANLLVTKGRALEALGREREAANIYFEALEINDALLRRTLEEGRE